MSIGDVVRSRRMQIGLSQQDLALALGYKTRSSVSKIEKGYTAIKPSKLPLLAETLRIPVEELLPIENTLSDDKYSSAISNDQREKRCVAVILAGGNYRVNQNGTPYQFVGVNGKPVFIFAAESYQMHPAIDEIVIVCRPGWEKVVSSYAAEFNISKLNGVIPAGNTGVQSVFNAVRMLGRRYSDDSLVILQESTRPLVDAETISGLIFLCSTRGNAVTYKILEETNPYTISDSGELSTRIDASNLITFISPEAYSLGLLLDFFQRAERKNQDLKGTICASFLFDQGADLALMKSNNVDIRVVSDIDVKHFKMILESDLFPPRQSSRTP